MDSTKGKKITKDATLGCMFYVQVYRASKTNAAG